MPQNRKLASKVVKIDSKIIISLQKNSFNKKNIFWCDLPLLAVFIFFVLFCYQVVNFIHLVFRQTRELNSRPRTMAQTASPRHSPLDQGASPTKKLLIRETDCNIYQHCAIVNLEDLWLGPVVCVHFEEVSIDVSHFGVVEVFLRNIGRSEKLYGVIFY